MSAPSAPSAPSHSPQTSGYAPLPSLHNDGGAREFLMGCKWPVPLQEAFIANMERTPLRYFICDDSGSMDISDGSIMVNQKEMSCTRYRELANALQFHIGFARAAGAPTEFRFLNALGPLRVGFEPAQCSEEEYALFMAQVNGSPSGGTPLCTHINQIAREISSHANQLRACGQRACLIIATDGESSDGDVAAALRPLKDLPVWVVIRLCTNEDRIVEYWNGIDEQLELNMDVLDDHRGEAKEIHKANPWLVYGEPLHRMREFGVSIKELDILDEKLIPLSTLVRIVKIFYGDVVTTFPNPELDAASFFAALDKEIEATKGSTCPFTWDPLSKKSRPFIDTKVARSKFIKGGCTVA